MENIELGHKIVDVMDAQPGFFDMGTWGRETRCGTAACLAGHAMLLSGYTYQWDGYARPDGTHVSSEPAEARELLGMEPSEEFGEGMHDTIWFDYEHGPDRFRKLVEESEGRR